MKVLGAHVRHKDHRFRAHFAVVDGQTVVAHASYSAPAGETGPGQLHELFVRALQLIDEHKPELLALRQTEFGMHKPKLDQTTTVMHAEGAVLAAAGQRDLKHVSLPRATLSKAIPKGDASRKLNDAVRVLCGELSGGAALGEDAVAAAAARYAVSRLS